VGLTFWVRRGPVFWAQAQGPSFLGLTLVGGLLGRFLGGFLGAFLGEVFFLGAGLVLVTREAGTGSFLGTFLGVDAPLRVLGLALTLTTFLTPTILLPFFLALTAFCCSCLVTLSVYECSPPSLGRSLERCECDPPSPSGRLSPSPLSAVPERCDPPSGRLSPAVLRPPRERNSLSEEKAPLSLPPHSTLPTALPPTLPPPCPPGSPQPSDCATACSTPAVGCTTCTTGCSIPAISCSAPAVGCSSSTAGCSSGAEQESYAHSQCRCKHPPALPRGMPQDHTTWHLPF